MLQAIGFDPIKARGSLRITLGRFNTMEEAERFVEVLPQVVQIVAADARAGCRGTVSCSGRERSVGHCYDAERRNQR